jgi:hypothetical protein
VIDFCDLENVSFDEDQL